MIEELKQAGFSDREGKGGHRNFVHPDEDQCYVGSAPSLLYGGCHGDDEKAVFNELCQIVEETIDLYRKEGKPLPPPTAGKDYANKLQGAA